MLLLLYRAAYVKKQQQKNILYDNCSAHLVAGCFFGGRIVSVDTMELLRLLSGSSLLFVDAFILSGHRHLDVMLFQGGGRNQSKGNLNKKDSILFAFF